MRMQADRGTSPTFMYRGHSDIFMLVWANVDVKSDIRELNAWLLPTLT